MQIYYYNNNEDYIINELIICYTKIKDFIQKGKFIDNDFFTVLQDTVNKRRPKKELLKEFERVLLKGV